MNDTFHVGDTATHGMYGQGTVTDVTSQHEGGEVVVVDFGHPVGVKKLLTAYAPVSLDESVPPQLLTYDDDNIRQEVAAEVKKALIRRRVRTALDEQAEAEGEPFDAGTLREVLARPADPPARAEGLIPWNASTLVVAQRKTGKTTFILNWARSLLTGDDFLGRFPTEPIGGNIALLNYEVSAATVAAWARDHDIDPDRVLLVNLRGRRNPLSHPDDRARLAELLRGHDVEAVAVDPFGRAFDGKSQNDAGEVTAWLVALDTFVRTEVGASDLLLAAHAGWNGERSRGSTALEDWADVVITLTRDAEDDSQRFLRAIGRDVDVDEDRLDFDAGTRHLTLSGVGSRKKVRDERGLSELAVLVVRSARETPGLSYAACERAIRDMDDNPGFRNGDVAKAARLASENGQLLIGKGLRGVSLTAIDPTNAHLSHLSPTSPGDCTPTSPTSPYRGEVEVGEVSQGQLSQGQEGEAS